MVELLINFCLYMDVHNTLQTKHAYTTAKFIMLTIDACNPILPYACLRLAFRRALEGEILFFFEAGSTVLLLYSVLTGFQLEHTLLVFPEERSDFQANWMNRYIILVDCKQNQLSYIPLVHGNCCSKSI